MSERDVLNRIIMLRAIWEDSDKLAPFACYMLARCERAKHADIALAGDIDR